MSRWTIEYDNDTGPGDGAFVEWWDVTDGQVSFRATNEAEGEDLRRKLEAFDALLGVCKRIGAWLNRLAEQSDRRARETTFVTLQEANVADAKNYRATAADVQKAIAQAEGRET